MNKLRDVTRGNSRLTCTANVSQSFVKTDETVVLSVKLFSLLDQVRRVIFT
jgi:hypothetical protein